MSKYGTRPVDMCAVCLIRVGEQTPRPTPYEVHGFDHDKIKSYRCN